jgi:hypothetical protein
MVVFDYLDVVILLRIRTWAGYEHEFSGITFFHFTARIWGGTVWGGIWGSEGRVIKGQGGFASFDVIAGRRRERTEAIAGCMRK